MYFYCSCFQVDEFERKCKSQQEQVYDLKEQLAHSQADYKIKSAQYEGRQVWCHATIKMFTAEKY